MSSLRHRQQLIALLDGKPASDWPLVIAAYNRSLLYDDNGNILSIIPFNASAGDGYIVLKNGEYDFPYTEQLNQEQSSQFWQSLGEQAAPILLGISEVIGGGVLWLGSSAVGAGGFVLALPSGGTLTIPAAAVASVGFATSGSLIAGGTITVTDAISQIVAANANLQIRFAKGYDEWKANIPTSKSFDPKIRNVRVGKKGDVGKVRVDAEWKSGKDGMGKIQVQTGSGKSGYGINRHLDLANITGDPRKYIEWWVKNTQTIKSFPKADRERLIDTLVDAYNWIKKVRGN